MPSRNPIVGVPGAPYISWWRDLLPIDEMPLNWGEPATGNWFLLEVDDVEVGVFREVKGLKMTIGTTEINEGGQNQYAHKVPGRIKWENIVFRRGLTQGDALFKWIQKSSGVGFAGKDNKLKRSTGAISAIDSVGVRLRSWNLVDVFPVSWTGPEFGSDKNNAQLEEELEIAHHGFTSETFFKSPI